MTKKVQNTKEIWDSLFSRLKAKPEDKLEIFEEAIVRSMTSVTESGGNPRVLLELFDWFQNQNRTDKRDADFAKNRNDYSLVLAITIIRNAKPKKTWEKAITEVSERLNVDFDILFELKKKFERKKFQKENFWGKHYKNTSGIKIQELLENMNEEDINSWVNELLDQVPSSMG